MSDLDELFSLLPDVNFIDVDTEATEQNIITIYEGLTNSVLYPADPVRLFLSTLASVISQLEAKLNNTGKMNLLRYASKSFLDHIGSLVGAYRTEETYAKTELQFTLQETLSFSFTIPAGTRVTSDGSVYFATDSDAIIEANTLTVIVSATCLTAGISGNGQVIGQLINLVDPLAYVIFVTNTTKSSGGAETEADEPYRERIAIAPGSFSSAGPILAYRYWALTAHADITDVSVFSPVAGTVQVGVLLSGGIIPDDGGIEITAVGNTLTAEERRPLCDTVIVTPARGVNFDYTVRWWILKSQSSYQSTIQEGIAKAIKSYEEWQSSTQGRSINPDVLIQKLRAAGAWRVEITGLTHTNLEEDQVAQFSENPNRIIYAGQEER
ncbi:baseplate J/gp47 family protein [Serratia sp. MF2]|uniref:baseplate J/gp47 family protein n=1 Tax=Serratia sp. MF1(2023) TaxID=3059171 RepID=UPI0027F03078|nr:baseplate J/gp47 family protein [Serratia sp. MF1(2023)]MDQ7104218.1 baseplate J/gp47 family protein [Serratia sp. MF1(2023)]